MEAKLMRKIAFLTAILCLFVLPGLVLAQDLFICDINIKQADRMLKSGQIEDLFLDLQAKKKENFYPGDAVGAALIFPCPREDALVEIEWSAPGKKIAPYTKLINRCKGQQIVITWHVLDKSAIGRTLGEKNAGQWNVQAKANGHLLAKKYFTMQR